MSIKLYILKSIIGIQRRKITVIVRFSVFFKLLIKAFYMRSYLEASDVRQKKYSCSGESQRVEGPHPCPRNFEKLPVFNLL